MKLTIDDFQLIKVLGKGSFGKVMLVQKKDDPTSMLLAMKVGWRGASLYLQQCSVCTAVGEEACLPQICNPARGTNPRASLQLCLSVHPRSEAHRLPATLQ